MKECLGRIGSLYVYNHVMGGESFGCQFHVARGCLPLERGALVTRERENMVDQKNYLLSCDGHNHSHHSNRVVMLN